MIGVIPVWDLVIKQELILGSIFFEGDSEKFSRGKREKRNYFKCREKKQRRRRREGLKMEENISILT